MSGPDKADLKSRRVGERLLSAGRGRRVGSGWEVTAVGLRGREEGRALD